MKIFEQLKKIMKWFLLSLSEDTDKKKFGYKIIVLVGFLCLIRGTTILFGTIGIIIDTLIGRFGGHLSINDFAILSIIKESSYILCGFFLIYVKRLGFILFYLLVIFDLGAFLNAIFFRLFTVWDIGNFIAMSSLLAIYISVLISISLTWIKSEKQHKLNMMMTCPPKSGPQDNQ